MLSTRTLSRFWLLAVALLAAQMAAVAPAEAQSGTYTDIYVLGRPASTFSVHPPTDLEELKDLFDRYEKDLRVVLEKGGWGGDPDDFFQSLRAAQEGDGTVTRRTVQPGETFQWMAYRKRGQPEVIRNPRWSAKKPFEAWQIKVESGGTEYHFVVPQSCMNLAYDKSKEMPAPTCDLRASFDAASDTITITGSSNAPRFEITSVSGPGGVGSGDLQSAGSMKWTLKPPADGRYDFTAEATSDGRKATCSASVQVSRMKPACDIDVSVDPDTHVITVDASGSRGDFALTGLTLPDGGSGDIGELQSVGDQRWTYDPSATLKKRPGTYSYTFAGQSKMHGYDSSCDAAAVITREAPEFRWIVRGYYAPVWPSTSPTFTEDRSVEPPIFTQFHVEEGSGFGLDVEYMAKPKIGIEFAAIFADMESEFMWDQGELWLMDEDKVDFSSLSLGVNYHFTPDRRVDFFLGGFVGRFSYDDTTFSLPEIDETFRVKFDDQFSAGLKAGIDVPFKQGGPWIFTAGLRYLFSELDEDGGSRKISIDPLIGAIGIGYRF